MRKIGIPLYPQIYYVKVGVKGVYIARIIYPDATQNKDIYVSTSSNFLMNRGLMVTFCFMELTEILKNIVFAGRSEPSIVIIVAKYLTIMGLPFVRLILSEVLKVKTFEPPHEKTNNLHMRNQRHRSASQ